MENVVAYITLHYWPFLSASTEGVNPDSDHCKRRWVVRLPTFRFAFLWAKDAAISRSECPKHSIGEELFKETRISGFVSRQLTLSRRNFAEETSVLYALFWFRRGAPSTSNRYRAGLQYGGQDRIGLTSGRLARWYQQRMSLLDRQRLTHASQNRSVNLCDDKITLPLSRVEANVILAVIATKSCLLV